MSDPKAGYLARAYLGVVQISGIGSWTYGGETRNMADIDEFGDTVNQLPLQMVGGDITLTGCYLIDTDAGQIALKTAFDAKTPITNLMLYTDYANGIYQSLKSGSHCICTNVNNIGTDSKGIGTFSATFHVNGEMEQSGSSIVVATLGDIDPVGVGAGSSTGTLWGELLHRGGEAGDIDCYFEYGETTSYGSDCKVTGALETTFGDPDKDVFDADIVTFDDDTTYHYRAVAEVVIGGAKVYGVDKTIVIPA